MCLHGQLGAHDIVVLNVVLIIHVYTYKYDVNSNFWSKKIFAMKHVQQNNHNIFGALIGTYLILCTNKLSTFRFPLYRFLVKHCGL